ncbi:hypothetical protein BROUX41_003353 [Berkeleyomyces rouxiae]
MSPVPPYKSTTVHSHSFPLTPSPDVEPTAPNNASMESPASSTPTAPPHHDTTSRKDSAAARKKVLSVSLATSDRPSVSSIIERLETRTQQEIEEQNRLEQLQLERLALESAATQRPHNSPSPLNHGQPAQQKDQTQARDDKDKNAAAAPVPASSSISSSLLTSSPEPRVPVPMTAAELQNTRGAVAAATTITTTTTTTQDQQRAPAADPGVALDNVVRIPSSASPSYSDQELLRNHFSSISLGNLDLSLNFKPSSEYSATKFNTLDVQSQSQSPSQTKLPQSQPQPQPQSPPSSSASVIQQLQNQIQDLAQTGQPFEPPPPLVRTTSHNGALPIRHPVPDVPPRSVTTRDNIAQLEATAVRLSMTSSIDDAIHNLHGELKRSDSRRSSILAASLKDREREEEARSLPALSRHISNASSIVSVNHVARLGGYSPGEYSITSSATDSISTRLRAKSDTDSSVPIANLSRSGPGKSSIRSIHSRPLAGIVETERETLSRVRSNSRMEPLSEQEQPRSNPYPKSDAPDYHPRSNSYKTHPIRMPSFEASTSETLSLGFDAQGAASSRKRLSSIAQNNSETETHPQPQTHDSKSETHSQPYEQQSGPHENNQPRRGSTASVAESERSKNIFGDFDGVHCDPDVDNDRHDVIQSLSNFTPMNLSDTLGFDVGPSSDYTQRKDLYHNQTMTQQVDNDDGDVLTSLNSPYHHHPDQGLDYSNNGQNIALPPNTMRQSMAMPPRRPQSYMDPETGVEMAYYPARVPMMLSLPQKLSKKPKAAQRNSRQSKVLSMMPTVNRESAPWLNNPTHLETYEPETLPSHPIDFLGDPLAGSDASYEKPAHNGSVLPSDEQSQQDTHNAPSSPSPTFQTGSNSIEHASNGLRSVGLDTSTNRESMYKDEPQPVPVPRKHARASHLPPQLRASVFFEMPSTTTDIKIQNGSATTTLDELLDASATAPVSAFTDHLIAGKSGFDNNGRANRRSVAPFTGKRHTQNLQNSASVDGLRKPKKLKKRGSQMSVGAFTVTDPKGETSSLNVPQAVRSSRRLDLDVSDNDSHHDTDEQDGRSVMQPDDYELDQNNMTNVSVGDDEEEGDNENEEEEEEEMYHGPPTTLLAELQLRKQQQKMRTRGHFPNGMHSTLLELDAVAERQRQNRVKGKVNLAWEEGAEGPADSESDEDVPLGLLYATKATGTKNLNLAVAEMNRPLGLMERRDLEDNEPLSSRRARIMGDHYTPMRNQTMASRAAPTGLENYSVESEEDEPLAARKARLKKEDSSGALPSTRPVSSAFSNELLTQFVAPEEEVKSKTPAIEAEETLGQRRRRLQAEREAASAARPAPAAGGQKSNLANILTSHPTVNANPFYSGSFNTSKANLGFKNGVYNTGRAGIRPSTSQMQLQTPHGQGLLPRHHNLSTSASMSQLAPTHNQHAQTSMSSFTQGAYGQPMYSQQTHGQAYAGYGMPPTKQVDMVERWRQSVLQ